MSYLLLRQVKASSLYSHSFFWILIVLIVTFLIRAYNFSFPFFTPDEARVAYRGYTLATSGKDELGRSFPLLFNSLQDYQLPTVSYITSLGILLFGKNDFGVRLPFILISVLIVVLTYKASDIFSPQRQFRILCALVAAFSPTIIFLSKIPNEMIVLAFGLTALFYLLTKSKVNLLSVGLTMIFVLATSKIAWWILIPFTIFTLRFFQRDLIKRTKTKITVISLLLITVSLTLFLQVPQSKRSLLENNFSLFQDTSILVLVDRIRGQGLESGWPNFLERILFNKLQFVFVGFFNWVDQLQPAILFGRFDALGTYGFMGMGAFPKIAVFPFVVGIIVIFRKQASKLRALIFYSLILTFPFFFVSQGNHPDITVLTLPFMTFIIAFGLVNLNRFLKYLCIGLLIFEVLINITYPGSDIRNTNNSRPVWVKEITEQGYNLSRSDEVAISDNIVLDMAPFLGWYTQLPINDDFKEIQFPYKFHQMKISNKDHKIRLVGSDDTFYFCGLDKPTYVFVSKRDLEKIQKWLNIDTEKTVMKVFKDDLGNQAVYLLKPTICLH